MPVPTAMTEAELKTYMIVVLGVTADVLGWTTGTAAVVEAVNDTLLAYGVSVIADATDIGKLRTLGRRAIWGVAVGALVDKMAFTADAASFHEEHIYDHALKMLALAEADAMAFGASAGASVKVDRLVYANDPYNVGQTAATLGPA